MSEKELKAKVEEYFEKYMCVSFEKFIENWEEERETLNYKDKEIERLTELSKATMLSNAKKSEEIERLKKDKEIDVKLNLELLDAVGKLNNILNELEKWLNYNAKHIRNNINFKEVLDKIKELRGDSK